ncbi:MAG TPA: alanine racemase [Hyphomicrobiales bacterium]|nr:alanine racemase [Hyphomicrobiales bacterium]
MMDLPFDEKDIPASATGVIVTDLDALVRNYAKLRELAAPAECAGVVKANGYGVGALAAGRALAAAGCRTFFVATLAEAQALRAELHDPDIYVLDGLIPGNAALFTEADLRPVLGDMDEIAEWSWYCRETEQKLPAALHVDTGMNRLGLKAQGQRKLLADLEILDSFELSLVMSHLACGDTPDNPKNDDQRAHFQSFIEKLPPVRASLANSAGVFLGKPYHFDLVRPGVALYGGNPFSERANPMEPVVRLYGRVMQTGTAKAGETVGYGAALELVSDTRYASVAIGYADGFFRSLGSSNKRPGAIAYAGDHPAPILGRVSMDLTVFDITDIPQAAVQRGGFLELIGRHFTVDDAGACAGSMAYEILTSLSRRCHRIYIGGTSAEGA